MEEDLSNGTGAIAAPIKKKHEDRYRKKDTKSWDNISKSVANLDYAAKFAIIEEKYLELYNEFRQSTFTNQTMSKQIAVLQKEKDHVESDLTKNVLGRARLENLCRELQKQNKLIKDQHMAKIKEEEERRKEVSNKFTDKLTDINNMMDENKEQSVKLRDENMKMTAKLAELYSQFQKREEDIAKMSHQLDLERQYAKATLAKMELEMQAEKEMSANEQLMMKTNLEKSESNCKVLLDTVKGLQDHIDIYKTQYQDFESTMSKSNKVFDNFKVELGGMSKKVNSLEKEAHGWKTKFHDSMKAIVELTEIKRAQDQLVLTTEKKNEQLQKLCRQLQADRSSFLKLLKTHGLEPTTPQLVKCDELEKCYCGNNTLDKRQKEIQAIKQNLKIFQDALTQMKLEEGDKAKKTDENRSQDSGTPVLNLSPEAPTAEN